MARIRIKDFISVGADYNDVVTKYQIATDPDFNNIVVDKSVDRLMEEIIDPIIMPDGSKYDGFQDIYCRIKLIVRGKDNGWFNIGLCNIKKIRGVE
jgi:hypothetical protein